MDILLKLRETGIKKDCESFINFQSVISEWVNTGESWSGKVEFNEYGRYIEGFLPKYSVHSANIVLKAHK
jgi:hypothetical protein